ncbi:hypothetical protein FHL15_001242 [Xylaria flabelliformis]|uniref:AB hydrolase-1 domain-containing protein n=1 Tax=Xylaria flabelliformis TaxID=2512241 RepID=A0A553ICV7_9PEZI|nr:hypothetical protein FHL15_001242 [Xylaria flabelliformis]
MDAILAFDRLSQEDVPCGVTLMGFTSTQGEHDGLEVWENATTIDGRPTALSGTPVFDQFSKFASPTTFAFSAIFQISQSTQAPLSLFGSSVLIAQAQKLVEDREGLKVGTQEFRRAPRLKIEGLGAEEVTRKMVRAYSDVNRRSYEALKPLYYRETDPTVKMASKLSFSGIIEGSNRLLYVEREGNPTGPTILFVHGLGGTTNAYQTLVSSLQEFDLVRFDWSGHGRSTVPESTSIESYVEDCEAVISHFNLEQVVVVGHSLGGLISLHLAAKVSHAVKAMVLFGPVCPPPAAGQTALAGRAAAVREVGMAAVADTVVSNAFASESLANRLGEVALAREMLTRQDPQGYALAVEALINSTLPELNRITIPTKLVSGKEDKVATVESGKSLVTSMGKHAEHISLPGVGHWYMLEAPAKCVEIIKSLTT